MKGSREDYIRYRALKSDEAFEDAKLLIENGRWNASVNRLYYSSFYLVTALLFQNKLSAQTHNGVKTNFFLHYVKTEKVSKDLGKLYSSLFDWRQESDYADFIDFDSETVSPLLKKVQELNDLLKLLLKE